MQERPASHVNNMLALGIKYETHVATRAAMHGLEVRKGPHRAPYDMEVNLNGKWYKVECKYDVLAHRTGNMFFQTHCKTKTGKWKEWGVMKQGPDYWVQGASYEEIYCARIEELRKVLNEYGRPTGGGEYQHTKGILLPIATLKNIPSIAMW